MNVLERVVEFLQSKKGKQFCDKCISRNLNITPDQHVNHKTRELEKNSNEFERTQDYCSECKKHKKVIRIKQEMPSSAAATDDADAATVLAMVRLCAAAWTPEARIVGNVRAGDIVRALDEVLPQLSSVRSLVGADN
ncbi:hypothetical protein [Pseudovibrio sp. Alg231-02]|uniref:hypothetical protein n=1 Tax=Pseudovibrio sp. Alg231-02 TaxID=1922223 RepID=UPI00190206CB|nr:hypothetical protein [Pseudovibrio sp. Alg231-02]